MFYRRSPTANECGIVGKGRPVAVKSGNLFAGESIWRGTWMIKRTIGNVDNRHLQTRSPAKRQTLAAPTASYPLGFDDYHFAWVNELVNQEGHKFINMMRFGYLKLIPSAKLGGLLEISAA